MLESNLDTRMGTDTEHIRKMGKSVEEAKRLKREIGSICGEINALLEESKAAKARRKKRGNAEAKARRSGK